MTWRSFIALTFLGLFLLGSCNKAVVYVFYLIEKERIAQDLCEKKDDPVSTCDGKCYLKKKLQSTESSQPAPSNSLKEKRELELYWEEELPSGNIHSPFTSYVDCYIQPSFSPDVLNRIMKPPADRM